MVKWTDIHDEAEMIVRMMLGRLMDGRGVCDGDLSAGTASKAGGRTGYGTFVDEGLERAADRLLAFEALEERIAVRERYDYKKAYGKLRVARRRRRAVRWLVALGSAACMAGLCLLLLPQRKQETFVAQRFEPMREVKAILVRADGEQYRLDTREQHMQDAGGVELSADSSGLRYETGREPLNKDTAVVYNALIVPRGGVYRLTLVDGTNVWLNSDSRLEYPVAFVGDTREVRLRGEAYFEVEKDSLKPFVVRTDLGAVTVLGTAFNIKYYPEESVLATTLVEGSVSFANEAVNGMRITPGCQLVFDSKTRDVSVRRVNVRYFVGWKDDVLTFQNERLADIMKVLSRWYDVTVVFESEKLKNLVFSGNLDKYDDISTFFKLFELSSSVRFSLQGKYVYVKEKK